MDVSALPYIAAAVGGLGVIASTLGQPIVRKYQRAEVQAERDRLAREVFNVSTTHAPRTADPDHGSAQVESDGEEEPELHAASRRRRVDLSRHGVAPTSSPAEAVADEPSAVSPFEKLLIDYYAHGLTQARSSFAASLVTSALGGVVLIAGAIMAIVQTSTQLASIVASVAGLLTSAIGTLFHRRADQSMRHLESQTQSLRQDMVAERDVHHAVQLLDEVLDPALKAHLQAALILKLSSAELPEASSLLGARGPAAGQPRGDSVLSPRGVASGS